MPVTPFEARIAAHLEVMYPRRVDDALVERVMSAIGIVSTEATDPRRVSRWDERTSVLITYADSLTEETVAPLSTLGAAIGDLHDGVFEVVHVLPFYPWSSDDGFSVIDHLAVDRTLGTWADLEELATRCVLMADLVVNHLSASSPWFRQLVRGEEPGRSAFVSADPDADLSAVVRPRTHPLLREVATAEGVRHLWCTFSHDQVDLDFSNPGVLLATLEVIDGLLAAGARWLRLDAVAYLWKEVGTSCIHLPQTHEFVKLVRSLLELREPDAVIVTETNVPHAENVSYLGDGDEAHVVYNFSLAPLLVHTVLSESSAALRSWAESLDPLPDGATFLNFIASHDGIGVRPIEELLSSSQVGELVEAAQTSGGEVSFYATPAGPRPYELNVSLFDLVGGPEAGVDRFLAAHTMMLAFAGVPAVYIHSLFGTPGDVDGMRRRGSARAINRRKLDAAELDEVLDADGGCRRRLFEEMKQRLALRGRSRAFHPGAAQVVLDTTPGVFGLRRGSGSEIVVCLTNVTSAPVVIDLDHVEPANAGLAMVDLFTGTPWSGAGTLEPFQSAWLSASTAS